MATTTILRPLYRLAGTPS